MATTQLRDTTMLKSLSSDKGSTVHDGSGLLESRYLVLRPCSACSRPSNPTQRRSCRSIRSPVSHARRKILGGESIPAATRRGPATCIGNTAVSSLSTVGYVGPTLKEATRWSWRWADGPPGRGRWSNPPIGSSLYTIYDPYTRTYAHTRTYTRPACCIIAPLRLRIIGKGSRNASLEDSITTCI